MAFFVGCLSYLLFLLALPFLLFHPKMRHGIRERFGFYGNLPLKPGPRAWFHGASAGDILALLPTVRAFKQRRPDVQIIMSTITNSGRAICEKNAALFSFVTYLPYDIPLAVRRSLGQLQPDVVVLEYTELWPNFIHAAARANVPLVLHNGRIGERNVGSYRRLFLITGNLLQAFSLLLMRDDSETERASLLGAPAKRTMTTGNTKFDNLVGGGDSAKSAELAAVLGMNDDILLWVAGSTHEGEEEILIDVFINLRKSFPALRLLITPRYVERAERLLQMATRKNLRARLRSKLNKNAGALKNTDIVVLDTIGELSGCYSLASLVFVGGSFVERGGQNILEPAACGKPVIFGPNMQNFADSVQVLLGRGGLQVATPEQLLRVAQELLDRPAYRAELGKLAYEQVMSIRGAAARNAESIAGLMQSNS